jgi:hypothetical protein
MLAGAGVLSEWTGDDLPAVADLGYEGEPGTFTLSIKRSKGAKLTDDHKATQLAASPRPGPRQTGERGVQDHIQDPVPRQYRPRDDRPHRRRRGCPSSRRTLTDHVTRQHHRPLPTKVHSRNQPESPGGPSRNCWATTSMRKLLHFRRLAGRAAKRGVATRSWCGLSSAKPRYRSSLAVRHLRLW